MKEDQNMLILGATLLKSNCSESAGVIRKLSAISEVYILDVRLCGLSVEA